MVVFSTCSLVYSFIRLTCFSISDLATLIVLPQPCKPNLTTPSVTVLALKRQSLIASCFPNSVLISFQSAVLKHRMACFISVYSSFKGRADFVPKCSQNLFLLTSACHRESGVAGLPHGGTLQCFNSGCILPFPTWCTSLLTCCPLSQLETQNGTSNILFWYLLQHKFIPGHITSPAKAIPLAFVNVLKESQRMLFYLPYQSSVLLLHIHAFSFCKSVICTENTFQWNS